jgi:hypothetical protein
MSAAYAAEIPPEYVIFVPAGIHLIENPKMLCSLLRKHNQYLWETTGVPIFGLKRNALASMITMETGEVIDLEMYIQQYGQCVESMELTNKTETKGKWFIVCKKSKVNEVHKFVDYNFKAVFERFVSDEDKFPDYPYPRQEYLNGPAASTTVGTYADVLRAYTSNPQDDSETKEETTQFNFARQRPKKQQAVPFNYTNANQFPGMESTKVTPAQSNLAPSEYSTLTSSVDEKWQKWRSSYKTSLRSSRKRMKTDFKK